MRRTEKKRLCLLAVATALLLSANVKAQDKAVVSTGADLVSGYYWRGQNLGGVSIQPTISVVKSGLSLTAWGSVGFDKEDTRELDFTVGYTTGNLNLAVTDYYFSPIKYFNYASHSTSHVYEATIGYNFGPFALSWNTNFAGNDYYKKNGERAYSTYVEASVPFKLGGTDLKAEVGCTPWDGAYTTRTDKFAVNNIAVSATKEIKVTDSFSIPAFAKVAVNPETEGAYFIFGVKF
jgi:hypothetical protein